MKQQWVSNPDMIIFLLSKYSTWHVMKFCEMNASLWKHVVTVEPGNIDATYEAEWWQNKFTELKGQILSNTQYYDKGAKIRHESYKGGFPKGMDEGIGDT
jgi:hypothetical protein